MTRFPKEFVKLSAPPLSNFQFKGIFIDDNRFPAIIFSFISSIFHVKLVRYCRNKYFTFRDFKIDGID